MIALPSPCPLCGEDMTEDQDLFSTWGVFFDTDDPLFRYCDGAMHWPCYANWEHRPQFARSYFDMWVDNAGGNFCWGVVYVDEDVLVTTNPVPPISSFCVVVAESGVRYMPKFDEWSDFVFRATGQHEAERTALERVLPRLRRLGDDPEKIAARACFPVPDDTWKPCSTRLVVDTLVAAQNCPPPALCPNCGRSGIDDSVERNVVPLFVCATCGRPALDP